MRILAALKGLYRRLKSPFRIEKYMKYQEEQLAPHIYAASASVLLPDNVLSINNGLDNYKFEEGLQTGEMGQIHFYLPHWRTDVIQSHIFKTLNFYELPILKKIDAFIKTGAHILDIGANIGNHSIYWAKLRRAHRIYAFEPIKTTFNMLERNIALNALDSIIKASNVALGEKVSKGSVAQAYSFNIGATSICEDSVGGGGIDITSLDVLLSQGYFAESSHIDFVKIDVEGFEERVFLGGKAFFTHFSPVIFVEIWNKQKLQEIIKILKSYNYHLKPHKRLHDNYIFIKG